jgi:hypothetical protein
MKKGTTICFRTSADIRNELEKTAEKEDRSVSSLIEKILCKYLENKRDLKKAVEDKRQYARKKVTVPSLISGLRGGSLNPTAATVNDISLGGLSISIPSDYEFEIIEDKENSRISIVFTLPGVKRSITTQCVPKHWYRSDGETIVGASFFDVDFSGYKAIQDFVGVN